MVYKPENSRISLLMLLSLISVDLVLIFIFTSVRGIDFKALLIIFFVIFNSISIYIILFTITMTYSLDEEKMVISGVFGLRRISIPLEEIESYTRSITLLDYKNTIGFNYLRASLGYFRTPEGQKAKLFITNSKKAILLNTKDLLIGISPEEAENFSAQLKKLKVENIPTITKIRKDYDYIDSIGRIKMRRIFNLTLLAIFLFFVLPNLLYYFGLYPKLIKGGFLGHSSASFLSIQYHLNDLLFDLFVAVFALFATYLIILNLATVEGIYYFQLMYFPLGLALLLLIRELCIIFNSIVLV